MLTNSRRRRSPVVSPRIHRHGRPPFDAIRRCLGAYRRGAGRDEVPPRGAGGAGRPGVRRGGPVPGAHRRPLAGLARAVRGLGRRVQPVPPVGAARRLAGLVRTSDRVGRWTPSRWCTSTARSSAPTRTPPGRREKKGQPAQGLGRSRGGYTTKLHLAAADERTPLAVVVTPGQRGDAAVFPLVLADVPEACPVEFVVADKAFDSDDIRDALVDRDIAPVIPSTANRAEPIEYDRQMYRSATRSSGWSARSSSSAGSPPGTRS